MKKEKATNTDFPKSAEDVKDDIIKRILTKAGIKLCKSGQSKK